jgi:hypothetical protein
MTMILLKVGEHAALANARGAAEIDVSLASVRSGA